MNEWPSLNSLVWLRLPCCNAEHPTRVEDGGDTSITVAAPIAPHNSPVPPLPHGEGFFLGWVMGRGALEVPVTLVDHSPAPVPTWTLKAIGQPTETQRRAYVRVSIELDVHLHLLTGGAVTKAVTSDLSEGGLRCVVDKWAMDPGNRIFQVEVPVGSETSTFQAQVAWWGNLNEYGLRTVGLRFVDLKQQDADRLRSFVFSSQLEQRRRERE